MVDGDGNQLAEVFVGFLSILSHPCWVVLLGEKEDKGNY